MTHMLDPATFPEGAARWWVNQVAMLAWTVALAWWLGVIQFVWELARGR